MSDYSVLIMWNVLNDPELLIMNLFSWEQHLKPVHACLTLVYLLHLEQRKDKKILW